MSIEELELFKVMFSLFSKSIEVCRALPTFDTDNCDAAEFKDNCVAFSIAMNLSKEVLAELETMKSLSASIVKL